MDFTTHIPVPKNDQEELHQLWSTPIILAKPFNSAFLEKLRNDVKYLLVPGGLGTTTETDLWKLPNLPDTMLEVKSKFLELAEKAFRPGCEMPLPPFSSAKAYFREVKPGSPYAIRPHRHAGNFGVGVFYITVPEKNPGNLMLLDPRGGINWTNQFSAYKKITVEDGLMVVHPGYLVHFVEPTDPRYGTYYDYRLALVGNIHRNQDEWHEVVTKNNEFLTSINSKDY